MGHSLGGAMASSYTDKNFEKLEERKYFGYANKDNCKVADGFTIKETNLKNIMLRYVDGNGNLLDVYKQHKSLIYVSSFR